MRSNELLSSIQDWHVALLIGLPVLGKVVIVWVALRGAQPRDRPKIISALADLFRWWRRADHGKQRE